MPTNIGAQGISLEDVARIGRHDVERLSQHQLKVGDIVFSRRGDVTKNALIREAESGWLCGTGCLKVRVGTEKIANAQFVSYYLRLPEIKDWLVRHAVGATMPNLNTGILSAVPVILPSLRTQHLVTEFLGELDGRIILLHETNRTLESIAQAIFKSWFVDFDPVRAKMEGRQPEGMNEETAALFPDSFEESELGLTPKEWPIDTFLSTVDVLGGGTPKTKVAEYWDGSIPWYSVVDAPVSGNLWVIDTEKHITQKGLDESSTRLLSVGTTIISARGTVGKLALTGVWMAMNQSCYGLRGRAGDVYFTYFNTCGLVDVLRQNAHGSVFDTITRETMSGIRVARPTPAVIRAFDESVSLIMHRLKLNVQMVHDLAMLRDVLLPRLISGQLRLPEAQELTEAASP